MDCSGRLTSAVALPARARAGRDLPDRVLKRAVRVPGAARGARAGAGAALPARGAVPSGAEHLSLALFGSWVTRGGRHRDRRVRHPAHWRSPGGVPPGHDAVVDAPLGPLSLDRQHRPGLLFVRLGIAPRRGGVPGDLPGQRRGRAAVPRDPDVSVARVPAGVRGGTDQAAWRSVLARPHVLELPPRDPTHAEPALVVLPSPAETHAPHGGPRELLRPADRPMGSVPAATDCHALRPRDDRHAGLPRGQRQLRLAELDHDRDRHRRHRRRPPALGAAVARRVISAGPALVRSNGRDRHAARGRALVLAGAQPRLAAAADECAFNFAPDLASRTAHSDR